MARLVLAVAILGVVFLLVKDRVTAPMGGVTTAPHVNMSRVPPEMREIFEAVPDPARMLRERGALPGLDAIREFAGGGDDEPDVAPLAPFADVGDRRALRKVRADIKRDIRALNRLSARGGASRAEAERTLAQVYSAPVLAALGPDGRRDFAARLTGRDRVAQRIKVLDFQGVFVAGRRALAQVVYRISTRAPSGRFVAGAPETWTVTLAREGGRWRFVKGIESS